MSRWSVENLPKDVQAELRKLRAQGLSLRKLSSYLATQGVSVSYSALFRWFRIPSLEPSPSGLKVPPPNKPLDVETQITQDKAIVTARAETSYYRKLYTQLLKDVAGAEKLVSVAREVTQAIPEVQVLYKAPAVRAASPQSVVAPLCDTHIGEYVDPAQMAGLNAYDMEIFNKRLHGWAEQVVKLVELRRSYANVPKLYVPMIGDMVSGAIRLEFISTNLDNVVGQMIRGAHLIAQALVFQSQYFKEIEVPCVVGNHGRMTVKPPSKDKYVDFDFLLYQWVAAFCRNQPNIRFTIPKSFLHVFQVEGRNILIMHGDSIHMWQSIPYYGIIRAVAQLRQTLQFRRGLEEDIQQLVDHKGSAEELVSLLAHYFDSVMMGHFHRHDEIDIGTGTAFICGCMVGGNEFSFGRLHTLSRPVQMVTYWHPKYGFIGKDVVYLERFDKEQRGFVDALPDVWVESDAPLIYNKS